MPILFLTVVIDLIGFGIIIPILPFIGLKLGISNLEIGLLIAIYSIFSGLFSPFWGRLSDRWGRKPILLLCLAGSASAYLFLAFAHSFWAILAARAFSGIMAGNFGIAAAIVADITSVENRAKSMGLIGAAFGVGMTLGPFIGGLLSGENSDLMLPALVASGLSLLAILAGSLFLKESLPVEKRLNTVQREQTLTLNSYQLLKQTKNRWLCLQYFLHNNSVSLFSYLLPLWAASMFHWGAQQTGIVFGIQGLIIIVIQGGLIGPLAKHLGELKLLTIGISLIIAGYTLALFNHSETATVAAFYIAISGATFCMPILNALLSKRTPETLRGNMMGTATSASAWGRMTAPLAGGFMLHYFGFTAAWLLGLMIGIVYMSWVINEWLNPPPLQTVE